MVAWGFNFREPELNTNRFLCGCVCRSSAYNLTISYSMKFFEKAEKLNQLDKLLRYEQTGNLDQLARRMNVSRSQMHNYIDSLKDQGFPIEYDRIRQTFYYTDPERLTVQPLVIFHK